jgi:hypothetical protein
MQLARLESHAFVFSDSKGCSDALIGSEEMRTFLKLVIALILCAPAVSAQRSNPPSDSQLAEITARGRMLADCDTASWHATDAVLALKPKEGATSTYVAKKTDAGWAVGFGRFNESKDGFLIVYEAIQGSNPQEFAVKQYDPPQKDQGFYFFAARAIETSLQNFRGEKRPYNTYVLPANSNQLYVYIVPAQTMADVYPLGGDMRYLVSPDGSTILETRQLHKTILEIKNSDKSIKVAGGYHTHVLSDVPEDTDVFHVLRRKPPVPEIVGTKSGIYIVQTDGTIKREK